MDYPNDNTTLRKNKHLNYEESMIIQIRLKDGFTSYKIAKELGRPINTIINEIRRGTTTQIKSGKTMEVIPVKQFTERIAVTHVDLINALNVAHLLNMRLKRF